ncbi:MAG TPA: helix-turn-helix domain-containing protein, partial [Steroidobacteraceae bacterium]|nr:helix-turn-helix domain-containing protein [Steroidobacteraceae bacterium]
NIRVVAATNRNLAQMVAAKEFRSDLYYRLNVVNIKLPPLRDRREDVTLLLEHYMRVLEPERGFRCAALATDTVSALLQYEWPGNVRELRNLVELLLLDPLRQSVLPEDLPPHMQTIDCSPEPTCERERLLAALCAAHWNKSEAAKQLHCSRMTLYRKILKYDLVQSAPAPALRTAK